MNKAIDDGAVYDIGYYAGYERAKIDYQVEGKRATRMITHVAIKHHVDGRLFSLPRPFRHHHVIRMMVDVCGEKPPIIGEQGFLTDQGEFVNRKEAAEIAFTCGQCDVLASPPSLFSEDLW